MEKEYCVLDGWWNVAGSYTREELSGIDYKKCIDYNDFNAKTNAWWNSLTPKEKETAFLKIYPIK